MNARTKQTGWKHHEWGVIAMGEKDGVWYEWAVCECCGKIKRYGGCPWAEKYVKEDSIPEGALL